MSKNIEGRETPKKVAWLLLPTFTIITVFFLWFISILNATVMWNYCEFLYPEMWIPSITALLILSFALVFTMVGVIATVWISTKWGCVAMSVAGILFGLLFYVCLIMSVFTWFFI